MHRAPGASRPSFVHNYHLSLVVVSSLYLLFFFYLLFYAVPIIASVAGHNVTAAVGP